MMHAMMRLQCLVAYIHLLTGVTAQSNPEITSCIGETFAVNCTVVALGHAWRTATLPTLTVLISAPTVRRPPYYILEIIQRNELRHVISRLSIIAHAELNGTDIYCTDANVAPGRGEYQLTRTTILGAPLAPKLTIEMVDLLTFAFTITPPLVASQCVHNYTITPTSSDGSNLTAFTVEVTDTEAPITLTKSGFDLCNKGYSFTIVANIANGTGEKSAAVHPELFYFLSPPTVSSTLSSISIEVNVDENTGCDMEGFSITATLGNSSGVIITERANYTNTTITIMVPTSLRVLPGRYTCSISVVNELVPVETESISCWITAPILNIVVAVVVVSTSMAIIIILVVTTVFLTRKRRGNSSAKDDDPDEDSFVLTINN